MSDTPSEAVSAPGARSGSPKKATKKRSNAISRFFAAIALFIRQVIAELRKVVTPTRAELGNYVLVVIVFLLVVMAFVTLLDFGLGKLMFFVFGD